MPVSELDADKNPVRGYVLGNEYISQVNGTTFGYYLNDEQGSVRYLTGSDGSIRNHYRYSAFGETITAEETVPNRLRYNGQMADGLTGLYYLRARYYNASLGRFTQEDVIYNDGLILYAYCNSNPVMYSDPSGFVKQCDSKVGGEKDSKSSSSTKSYSPVEYKGSVKVNGEVRDASRRVYQRNDIDINYYDEVTGLKNLERMQAGRPPIGSDGNPIQLHHILQKEAGPMVEIRETTHQEYYLQLHGLIEDGASFRNDPILNKQYNNFRRSYWKWRAEQIIGGQ